jgi:hypothetical protein
MFWPLGLWLADTSALPALKRILMFILPLGLAIMTHARAEVWGNARTQALIWARINPNSARAQANAAQLEVQEGRPHYAVNRLQMLLASQPDQIQLALNLLDARCMEGRVQPADIAAARTAMGETSNLGSLFAHWFDRASLIIASNGCPGLMSTDLLGLIDAGLRNPKLAAAGPQQDLVFLRGRIALARHLPNEALADFIRALDLQIRPDMALEAAATLGTAGYPAQGLVILDHYQHVQQNRFSPEIGMPMLHEWVLARENYWPNELGRLRQQLSLDGANGKNNAAQSSSDKSAIQ